MRARSGRAFVVQLQIVTLLLLAMLLLVAEVSAEPRAFFQSSVPQGLW